MQTETDQIFLHTIQHVLVLVLIQHLEIMGVLHPSQLLPHLLSLQLCTACVLLYLLLLLSYFVHTFLLKFRLR